MSDPVTNDYAAVPTLSEAQQHLALLTLACLNGRSRKPRRGDASFDQIIDMLGLTPMTTEIRRERGLGAAPVGVRAVGGVRDSYGRLRHVPASGAASSEVCPAGDHPWIAENIYTNETTGRKRCKLCRNRRKQNGGAEPKAADAPLLCKCPDETHILTKETSATTYVTKSGKRLCKVGEQRRKKASQARRNARKAAEAVPDPGLKPGERGERWCGCEGEKHLLTPESSATTYVYTNGKRRCRAARQRAQRERHVAVRKGTAA